MNLLKDKRFMLMICVSGMYGIEFVAEQNITKHLMSLLFSAGCTFYGGHLAYGEASKLASSLQLAIKKGAKTGREKATEEITKPKG